MSELSGPMGPRDDLSIHQRYQKDLQAGAKLFKKALHSYEATKDPKKRYEFKQVMNESLEAIHKAVVCLKNEELKRIDQRLHEDYNDVEKNPDRVKADIDDLRKNL